MINNKLKIVGGCEHTLRAKLTSAHGSHGNITKEASPVSISTMYNYARLQQNATATSGEFQGWWAKKDNDGKLQLWCAKEDNLASTKNVFQASKIPSCPRICNVKALVIILPNPSKQQLYSRRSYSVTDISFAILQYAPAWITLFISLRVLIPRTTKKEPHDVSFDDLVVVDTVKIPLVEIINILGKKSEYTRLGVKPPKMVLLCGPLGTGISSLGHALGTEAREAGISFFIVSASEYAKVETGATGIKKLFHEAIKSSPSIVYIDGIDAIGGQHGNCERNPALSQLLIEMDECSKDASVVVIAATNISKPLDSALMRSGRLSTIHVGKPDTNDRQKIFALKMKEVPMNNKEAICKLVASQTPGLVGADLENIANESKILAARRRGNVTLGDILQAVRSIKSTINDDKDEAMEDQ